MAMCPYCGESVPDGKAFCTNCGASLKMTHDNPHAPQEVPKPEDPFRPAGDLASPQDNSYGNSGADVPSYQSSYQSTSQDYDPVPQPPAPIPVGGLIAWSIFVILFCTIPGVVSIIKVRSINQAPTLEEQQLRMDSAKKWLIAGTVLAVLNIIIQIISRSMS